MLKVDSKNSEYFTPVKNIQYAVFEISNMFLPPPNNNNIIYSDLH